MGTAKISDITSFFNMSTGNIDMPGKAGADKELFAQAMSDAAGKGAQNTAAGADSNMIRQAKPDEIAKRIQKHPANTADQVAEKTDKTADTDTGNKTDTDNWTDTDNRTETKNKAETSGKTDSKTDNDATVKTEDGKQEAVEMLEELTGKIRNAIMDELDVDVEQLELAMSALGLAPVDLLDTDNIKALMLEVSGEQDPMVLITNEGLFNSIGNVTELVEVSIEELTEEFGITAEQLTEIAESAENTVILPAEAAADNESDEEDVPAITSGTGAAQIKADTDNVVRESTDTTVSPTQASIQRKEASQAKDGSAEGNMQNAMQGQEVQQTPVNEAVAVPESESPTPYVDREDILRQVTDNIKLNISGDSASMELQLHPASLGTVNLQIASNNGVITANLQVQNETVKGILESQLVQLLETFEEQGQKVEAIEVSVAGYDLDRSLNQESGSQDGERREGNAQGVGRTTRRRINLNELDEEDIEELTEEEQLAAEMMAMNGGNVDFMA